MWGLWLYRAKLPVGCASMCVPGQWHLCKRETGIFVVLSWWELRSAWREGAGLLAAGVGS